MFYRALTWSKKRLGHLTPPNELERLMTLPKALESAMKTAIVPAFLAEFSDSYLSHLNGVLKKYFLKGELVIFQNDRMGIM